MNTFRLYLCAVISIGIISNALAHPVRDSALRLFTDMRENTNLLPALFHQNKQATQEELAAIEHALLRASVVLEDPHCDAHTRTVVEKVVAFYSHVTTTQLFDLKRHQARRIQQRIDRLSTYIHQAGAKGLDDELMQLLLAVNAHTRAFFDPHLYPHGPLHERAWAACVHVVHSTPWLGAAAVTLGATSLALGIALCSKSKKAT